MKTKMNKRKKIIITIVLSFVAICIALTCIVALRISYLTTPTKGGQIASYASPQKALLVIDIQNDTFNNSLYKNTDIIMKKINDTITYANEQDFDVIYIKQEYRSNPLDAILSGGFYKAGSEGSNLSSRLVTKAETVFTKNRSDAFSSSQFEEYLKAEQINTLYLVGADASACVYGTARGGINRGYNINILKDAVFAISDNALTNMTKKYSKYGIGVNTTEVLFEK